jgi:LytS/YehU family sensor histidine kinase
LVPQLFFQPLVEYAIRHGIAERETGGVIDIRAERQNGMLQLRVRDNGPGLNVAHGNLEEGGLIVSTAFPFHTETIIEAESKR